MKRGAIGIIGFAYGVFWVWVCLYAIGHTEWAGPGTVHSCVDAGNCTWARIAAGICYVLAPPLVFGALNGAAWRRWPTRKWAGWFLGLSVATALLYAVVAVLTR